MVVRIAQRSQDSAQPWVVAVTLRRGTTAVNWINDTGVRYMPFAMGLGQIAWSFVIPASVPASGTWGFYCPILSEFDPQDVGVCIAGGSVYPASLDTGMISVPTLVPGVRATIRGMVAA